MYKECQPPGERETRFPHAPSIRTLAREASALCADCGARSAAARRLVEQTRVRCQSLAVIRPTFYISDSGDFGLRRFRTPAISDSGDFGLRRFRTPAISDSGDFGLRRFRTPAISDSGDFGLRRFRTPAISVWPVTFVTAVRSPRWQQSVTRLAAGSQGEVRAAAGYAVQRRYRGSGAARNVASARGVGRRTPWSSSSSLAAISRSAAACSAGVLSLSRARSSGEQVSARCSTAAAGRPRGSRACRRQRPTFRLSTRSARGPSV